MRICIARNAEARTNAAIARITDALDSEANNIILLTRNRFAEKRKKINIIYYKTSHSFIPNYEISLKSQPGKGIINIFQLIHLQIIAFFWFFKNRNKFDVIHAFDLDMGLPAYLLSIITKKKYVYHIADFYVDSRGVPYILKPIIRWLEFLVINRATATIICTEDRESQIEGSKPKNLTVIHNTPSVPKEMVDILSFKDEISSDDNSNLTLTYVGSLSEKRFIKSAIEIIKDIPNITLHIAGMGTLTEYVKDMSSKYTNINFHGMVDYKEALKLYSKTDLMFALYDPGVPNHKYSAPNKVYEAMMLGKPIIVAKNTGVDKIVKDNEMGLIINYSEKEFKNLLFSILDKSINLEELGTNAKRAYQNYSWCEMKERLVNLYKKI